jgi:4-alpha-glucanotransferase
MATPPRHAGILLHPTCLPGPHGSGDLGPAAFHFVDWLAAARQSLWQTLPLTPVGPGNSPYASVSAFAGSPLLVALEPLVERGWLAPVPAEDLHGFGAERIDYERVIPWRMAQLRAACAGFEARATAADRAELAAFRTDAAHWLDDYALFMALDARHRAHGIWHWPRWDAALARREPAALAAARADCADEITFWCFVQWCFARQWQALHAYARSRGVALVGDLPIFVAHHSADCWARPDLFLLDADFEPQVVAGVPPDYFSATGQRWGNPLYDWAAMAREGYAWWIARLRHELSRCDSVRIDHFRGFAGYWEIAASCPTAIDGRWRPGPGAALFDALRDAFGGPLPLIAEDLGIITADVEALRDAYGLPGMKVLQFAFGGDGRHAYLPHNYTTPNCCVYTGTHDNDTALGWWQALPAAERHFVASYLGADDDAGVPWALVRAAWSSIARLAICPLQDLLGLDTRHRMNTPGQIGCWTWRFRWDQVAPDTAGRLAELTAACGRVA